ncbi:MAG: PTS sugar transporter subunit IIA [Victivallaceae bacterium]|nr:PTS sugar transporter subunit IIA [Victivallaceae bacterium]MDD4181763.1 PTS sugar transporter subunit IIA [Victivallaceae bacterium]MDD4395502.1 PTS sugar transporter subunit IIA [Bacteroidales bacterium]
MHSSETITLERAAAFLRISEQAVRDLVRDGALSSTRTGSEWHFKIEDLEKFVAPTTSAAVPILNAVLSLDCVAIVEDANKETALRQLIAMLGKKSQVNSISELTNAIFNREKLMSTGIGMGIGIPHVRLRSVTDLTVAVLLVKNGIPDYESMDAKSVKIIFMIAARENQHALYLKLLSQISSFLKIEKNRTILKECCCPEDLYHKLKGYDDE